MRLFKITLSIVFLIIAIAILAAVALVYFVNPNQLKPVLIQEARKAGYDLTIDGDLSWNFYPRVAIEVPHLTIHAVGQTGTFVDIQDLRLGTALTQLWHNKETLSGKVYAESIRFGMFRADKVSAHAEWFNQILKLDDIDANAYGGSLSGIVNGSNFARIPQWDWNIKLEDIHLQSLLMDIAANNKISISGNGYINFQGNTTGKNKVDLTNNLNGALDFGFKDGVIEGVDLNYIVHTVDALLKKKDVPEADGSHGTAFSDLSANVAIRGGIANSDNLLLISPAFTTKGSGTLSLLDDVIKMDLRVLPLNMDTQWQIPINVSGTLSKPDVSLDKDEVARFLAKQQLQKMKEKASNWIQNFLNR